MHCLVLHYITMHHTMVIESCIVFIHAICRSQCTLYDIMLYNDSSHVTVYAYHLVGTWQKRLAGTPVNYCHYDYRYYDGYWYCYCYC